MDLLKKQSACRVVDEEGQPIHDPELWFPLSEKDLGAIARAQHICAICPRQVECLQDAFDLNANFGIWGGFTEWERKGMSRRFGAGAYFAISAVI